MPSTVLLGYLLSGGSCGPAGLIKRINSGRNSQFGVAFFYALGVEFSFAEIKKVQWISLGGVGCKSLTILVLVSVLMGWVPLSGCVLEPFCLCLPQRLLSA